MTGLPDATTVVEDCGVAVTVGPQLQESTAVHPARRHIPDAQIRSDGQSEFVEQDELQLGPHEHVSTAVQPGRRHRPDWQMRSEGH